MVYSKAELKNNGGKASTVQLIGCLMC